MYGLQFLQYAQACQGRKCPASVLLNLNRNIVALRPKMTLEGECTFFGKRTYHWRRASEVGGHVNVGMGNVGPQSVAREET